MKKDETFREFNSDMELLPWELVLVDIPEPDPGNMDFRQNVKEHAVIPVEEPGIVTKLIDYLNLKN